MNADERGSKPADARFKPSTRRFVLACVVAPLLTPLTMLVAGFVFVPSHVGDDFFSQLFIVYLYWSPVAYLAELLLGLPAWKIFQHYRIQSGMAFALGGGLIGLVPAMLLQLGREGAVLCSIAGLASALLFRGIIFWGTPNLAGD